MKQPLTRPDGDAAGDEQGKKEPIDTQTRTGQHLRVFVVEKEEKEGRRTQVGGGKAFCFCRLFQFRHSHSDRNQSPMWSVLFIPVHARA
jgi:hypothetical protein